MNPLDGLGELHHRLRETTMPAMDRLLTTVRSTHSAGGAQSTRSVLSVIVGESVAAVPSRTTSNEE